MTEVVFTVVDSDEREGPKAPQRGSAIDWLPLITTLLSGQTVEVTLPLHPRFGSRDDRGRMTSQALRNAVVRHAPEMRLRTRGINLDERRVIVWLEPKA